MIISTNFQLGLRLLKDKRTEVDILVLYKDHISSLIEDLENLDNVRREIEAGDLINPNADIKDVRQKIYTYHKESLFILNSNSKYFMICESVYKCAELIKIGNNFTGRVMKDIKSGIFTYLMGKNRMVKFQCIEDTICGIYVDVRDKICFEWGIDISDGRYFYSTKYIREFSTIMQLITFIELGDVEVKILESGRNNGATKDKKIHNSSHKTVYVVDSSWNQIIIRTEGFAVRGHFRLQVCGPGLQDRKLIWIDAFEKHGYKRKPKGEIVNG